MSKIKWKFSFNLEIFEQLNLQVFLLQLETCNFSQKIHQNSQNILAASTTMSWVDDARHPRAHQDDVEDGQSAEGELEDHENAQEQHTHTAKSLLNG